MGAPPLDLDDDRLVRIAEDSARSGVVMLVPFSRAPRRPAHRAGGDRRARRGVRVRAGSCRRSIRTRVGFFGASVGGSLALVAAADPRIADDVDHVVSFGGYYDALDTFGAIATHHIEYDGVDEEWTPREHAEKVMAYQLIDRVDNAA